MVNADLIPNEAIMVKQPRKKKVYKRIYKSILKVPRPKQWYKRQKRKYPPPHVDEETGLLCRVMNGRMHIQPECSRGYVVKSRYKAMLVFGKYLAPWHLVHHLNGNKLNDANNNLVICENQVYHMLLHKRLHKYLEGNKS